METAIEPEFNTLFVHNKYGLRRGEYILRTYRDKQANKIQGLRFNIVYQPIIDNNYKIVWSGNILVFLRVYTNIIGRIEYPCPTYSCLSIDEVEKDKNTLSSADLDIDGVCLGAFRSLGEAKKFVCDTIKDIELQRKDIEAKNQYINQHTFI